MENYAFGKTRGVYHFRNGGNLKIHAGFDHVPIIEVMLKKDYGVIPDKAVIVDIGASTGVFSIYAASTAKDVSIYAYEPSDGYFSTLKENVHLNGLDNSIHCFKNAVAGKNEKRSISIRSSTFIYPSLMPEQEGKQEVIDCITLEKIFVDNKISSLDLLKMDCEGAEYEIFEQTPVSIMQKVKEIRMEYHNLDQDKNVSQLRSLLKEKGFEETYFKATNEVFGNIWFRKV